MKTLVLLTLFCAQILSFEVLAQYQQIIPFEDYRECYTGFKNYAGDTIHEAKFSNAYVARTSGSDFPVYCWIVQEMGRYGILSSQGDYVVKSEYDTLFQCVNYYDEYLPPNWLITVRQGRYGMIDFDGKEVLPPIYSEIQPYEPWLKVRNSEGKVALMDSSLNLVVPFNFEELHFSYVNEYSMDSVYYNPFFQAKKNGYFGIIREDLTPLLPYEFDDIRLIVTSKYFRTNYAYFISSKNGLWGLYQFEGKQVIPCEYEAITITRKSTFFQKNLIPTAIANRNKKQTFWNLKTGDESERFHEIRAYGGKAIGVQKNGRWAVIDSNGSTVGKGKKQWRPDEETLSLSDSIVVVSTSSHGRRRDYQKLMYHYGNGTYSSEGVRWMTRMEVDGETFCWVQSDDKIIIFDSQLNKVKTFNQNYYDEFSEVLEGNEIPTLLPIQVLENEEGLIGGFNARGTTVIPQIYTKASVILKDEPHKYAQYWKVPDYYEFSNNTSIAYYTLNGELLRELNFSEIQPLGDKYYAARSGKYTSVLDANYNVVLDSCTRAFQTHSLNTNWSVQSSNSTLNNYYPIYAFRNGKALELVGGRFVLMDSTRYVFKQGVQLQFDVLIDRSGSIVSPEGARVRRVSPYYLAEKDHFISIMQRDGTTQLRLDDVRKCEFLGSNLFHCILRNGQQGVYNSRYSKWNIPLEKQYISPISGNYNKAKYTIRRPNISSQWQFYSANGNLVSDLELDDSFSQMGSLNLVRIEGSLGVMTEKLEMLILAEYDYISYYKNSLFLRKNRLWYKANTHGSNLSNGYTSISTRYYPKGRLVFQGNRIGVIDEKNVEIIAPTDEKTLLSNYDLAKLLIPTNRNQINQFPLVSETNAEQAKEINNRTILDASRFHTTLNDVMPKAFQHGVDSKYVQTLNRTERDRYEDPQFFSPSYYSKEVYSSSETWGQRDYRKKESTEYYNYSWKNGNLEKIQLADLFKSPYYEPYLDSLIIDYMNKNQLYGVSCVNLEEVITMAKKNFVLSPEGLILLAISRNSSSIMIPYEKLRDFLKRPEEFME